MKRDLQKCPKKSILEGINTRFALLGAFEIEPEKHLNMPKKALKRPILERFLHPL